MEKLITYLAENWLAAWGFAETAHWLLVLTEIGLIGGLFKLLQQGGKWLLQRHRDRKLAKNLHPFFSLQEVKRAKQHYIETTFQNVNPAAKPEPGQTAKSIARQDIMPFFLKEVFDPRNNEQRFYLLLAGSGMGKTTFMLNLYQEYVKPWKKPPYNICLLPFGNSGMEKQIKSLVDSKEDKNTILLLDAFDEDKDAMKGQYRERLDTIMDMVQNFQRVIITSRTQFFESEDDIPGELKIPRSGTQPGFHHFMRLYISPFNEKDIRTYLNKKYGSWKPWNKHKKQQALKIALGPSIHLMARPMLLSNIDDLLNADKPYEFTYQIYERLIESWLEREASRVPEAQREKFKKDLYAFSRIVAIDMYGKATVNADLSISPEMAKKYAKDYDIELTGLDLRSRSLLNVKADGYYKFAHRSIMEYFLAVEAKKDADFLREFMQREVKALGVGEEAKTSMDMARSFIIDMLELPEMVLVETKTKEDFYIGKTPITVGQYRNYCEISGKQFPDKTPSWAWQSDHPMIYVTWYDAQEYCKWLGEITGGAWRLPVEVEWEYAAKGGKKSKGYEYAGSNRIGEVAWYSRNSKKQTQPVEQLRPNELGLYDMSGNVWEWCEDIYDKDSSSRVMRGGGWSDHAFYCQVAYRFRGGPSRQSSGFGFRVARTP